MNNRKGTVKSKKTKGKYAKPPVRKKACRPPKSWYDLSDVEYNPNGNPTMLSPYMKKFVEGLRESARKKEELLIERITSQVVKQIIGLLECGKVKLPEKEISFTLSPDDYRIKPESFEVLRKRHKELFAPIKSKPKRSTKK